MIAVIWTYIESLVSELFSLRPRRRRHRARYGRNLAFRAECLEQRHLLAANPITFDAETSSVTIQGTAGNDVVQVWSDATRLHVSMTISGETSQASFGKSSVALVKFLGGDGDDRFQNTTSVDSVAWGEAGNDTLIGGSGNDRLYGRAGDDTLAGGAGNDELYGDEGADRMTGEAGDDRLDGGSGNDELLGGTGNDSLIGGTGNDKLYGNNGNDSLWGQAGNDRLDGGDGDDRLYGGDGNDTILGGNGADELYGNNGKDRLAGQAGNDRLEGGAGDDDLKGHEGDDTLIGNDGNDVLDGGEGNDRMWGQKGNDLLFGGIGNDELRGDEGDDVLLGGDGNDSIYGASGTDVLLGENGNDRLEGDSGDDWLDGGVGDDSLLGGAGNDEMYGGSGQDRMWGEEGDDKLDGGIGDDIIHGDSGNDSLVGDSGNDMLYGDHGNDRMWGGNGNDRLEGGIGDDALYGNSGADTLIGGDGNDLMYGQAGNDRLWGQAGNDRLDGGADNDEVYGGTGNDSLFGYTGDDLIYGEDGNDFLSGSTGTDRLDGGRGNDLLDGGSGDDVLIGADGNDRLTGSDGNDQLWGQGGKDILFGSSGMDFLYGGDGDDVLYGAEGHDELHGGADNDVLMGEDGNDFLNGDAGEDILVGGTGDDRLVGDFGNDILIGGAGADSLWGQNGDDLLIGGMTGYDQTISSLVAISHIWSTPTLYSQRVQQLEDESFAARLILNETVFDDAVADSVVGGNGQDLFFQTVFLGVYVPHDVHTGQMHGHSQPVMNHNDSHAHLGHVILDHPPAVEGFDLVSAMDAISDRQSAETIHSILPNHGSSVLQREHLTLFQLVRYDQVTHYAVHSGNWSDASTWHNGIVPGTNAKVLIPLGVEVRVDRKVTTRLSTVRVDGVLTFETSRDTELRADTVVVFDTGYFEMGTATSPIAPGATARLVILDNGAIDRTADPYAIGRGLITHGKVSIFGAEVSSYAALAGPALAGTNVLSLKIVPTGWKVGDTLAIAATTAGTQQNEVRKIVAILGGVVVLNQPLDYNHVSPASALEVHVANMTRNAVIESESSALDRRGHVMFMHNADVTIAFAGFYQLGRTNKMQPINDPVVNSDWNLEPGTGTNPRARYAVHFHRAGLSKDTPPAVIVGSAVVDSPGWGFVNHSSHVDMFSNVAFDVHGAAFTTEVGDEIGRFIGNLALGTTGSGERVESRLYIGDFGHRGDGFWIQGVSVLLAGNIAAGNQGSAFNYYARGLSEGGVTKEFLAANLPDPSIAGGSNTIDIGKIPVFGFTKNVGYASGEGLSAWYLMEKDMEGRHSVLSDSLFWNNTVGVDVQYARKTEFDRLTVVYIKQPQEELPQSGVRSNGMARDITFNHLNVAGYRFGIEVPRRGNIVINGGNFSNQRDFLIHSGIGRNMLITGLQVVPRITMNFDSRGVVAPLDHVFLDDVVILDFGPFHHQRLYYTQQLGDAVPITVPRDDLPLAYVGLTNQQLWDRFGIALGGAIAPADAYTLPEIVGLIGP